MQKENIERLLSQKQGKGAWWPCGWHKQRIPFIDTAEAIYALILLLYKADDLGILVCLFLCVHVHLCTCVCFYGGFTSMHVIYMLHHRELPLDVVLNFDSIFKIITQV